MYRSPRYAYVNIPEDKRLSVSLVEQGELAAQQISKKLELRMLDTRVRNGPRARKRGKKEGESDSSSDDY